MFQLFQSYVAVALSVFMLQVASVLSECCIGFTHMLQVYVPDVLFVSYVCYIQVLYIVQRVRGRGAVMVARHWHRAMGRGELGADRQGAKGARCACRAGRTPSN
jgi:hypothetical protein